MNIEHPLIPSPSFFAMLLSWGRNFFRLFIDFLGSAGLNCGLIIVSNSLKEWDLLLFFSGKFSWFLVSCWCRHLAPQKILILLKSISVTDSMDRVLIKILIYNLEKGRCQLMEFSIECSILTSKWSKTYTPLSLPVINFSVLVFVSKRKHGLDFLFFDGNW